MNELPSNQRDDQQLLPERLEAIFISASNYEFTNEHSSRRPRHSRLGKWMLQRVQGFLPMLLDTHHRPEQFRREILLLA